jgi:serine/threonine-protein kinase
MAPEQLLGESVDHRTDLYSTGAVLYECLTGRPVFDAPNLMAIMAQHVDGPPPDPTTLNPDVPHALSAVVVRALSRRPEDRWQSALDLLRALETV